MPGAGDESPLVRSDEETFPALAQLRRVHRVECAVQRERGHALVRRRIEARLERSIARIAGGVTPARAIRMQRYVGPIRIIEGGRRTLELRVAGLVRDEP